MSVPINPGVIELRLKDIRQLFNSLDATPFPDCDLDANAEEFIIGWAMEQPPDAPLVVRVHLQAGSSKSEQVAGLEDAIHNYFAYRADVISRQFRQLMRDGRISLVIGLTCLAAALAGAELMLRFEESTFSNVLRESLIIGGWVAMWRSIQIFLFDWWPLRHHRRVCLRLSESRVEVVQTTPPGPT